jgi:hypothetical protein
MNKLTLNTPSQCLPGFLESIISVVFCLDTGATISIISKKLVNELEKLKDKKKTVEIDFDMSIVTVDNSHAIKIKESCKLNIRVDTKSGKFLNCKDVEFYIADMEMTEVILGNQFLKDIGIDVCRDLALIADHTPEWDFEEKSYDRRSKVMRFEILDKEEFEPPRPGTIPKDHPDFGDDLPDPIEDLLGGNDPVELRKALEGLIIDAAQNGASNAFTESMSRLFIEYEEVWRLALGDDPPVLIEPMLVTLKPGTEPYKTSSRRYAPLVQDFMKLETDRQIKGGFAYVNRNSHWASSPFCVRKRVKEGAEMPPLIDAMRMTVDLREVNRRTVTPIWPMPNLEVMLRGIAGAKVFALFDLTSGYWQFPLDPSCQEIFSYMTDRGIFTPTRVPQGAAGSVAYVQSQMCLMIGDELLYEHAVPWIDDILVWANNDEEMVEWLRKLFERCKMFRLKLHAKKSRVYTRSAIWCGRVISPEGVSHDPSRLETLRSINLPVNGADLQQFICAVNWLQMTLPTYAPVMAPLLKFMEKVYVAAKGRTKKKVKHVNLASLGWGKEQDCSWENVKQMLSNSMTLANPDPEKITCVFTDASEDFWGAIVTQIPQEDKDLPIEKQRHQLLAFLSHAFKGCQLRWAIIEKEAYALVTTCVRLDYLLIRQGGFRLYTDHRNLQFIFSKSATETSLHKHTAAKLQRWSLLLMAYEYEIIYIEGERNVWADLLSRWGATDKLAEESKENSVKRVLLMPISPTTSAKFVWPTLEDIQISQVKHSKDHSTVTLVRGSDNIWRTIESKLWIPISDKALQIRLCIVAHCGTAGHRGYDATLLALEEVVYWKSIKHDLKRFINDCYHCIVTSGPFRTPRPLGEAIHSDRPNEVLHMDWLYMRGLVVKSKKTTPQYIHVLLDDASRFLQLTVAHTPTAASATDALLQWSANFGIAKTWVSDGASHYVNEVVKLLSERLKVQHHIVVAHSPWANGTVETMMSQILRVFRALLSEWRMHAEDWPLLVPIVQSILNHAPSSRLGGRAPIEAYTGLPSSRPLNTLIHPETNEVKSIEEVDEHLIKELKVLALRRNELHKHTARHAQKLRDQQRARINKEGKRKFPNFIKGDYVLVGILNKSREKLKARWKGPKRITEVLSDWKFEVEDLISFKKEIVHAERLKYYSERDLEITEELRNQIAHNADTLVIESIKDIKYNNEYDRYLILVKWKNFEDDENSWEYIEEVWETTESIVKNYLKKKDNKKSLKDKALKWLSQNYKDLYT